MRTPRPCGCAITTAMLLLLAGFGSGNRALAQGGLSAAANSAAMAAEAAGAAGAWTSAGGSALRPNGRAAARVGERPNALSVAPYEPPVAPGAGSLGALVLDIAAKLAAVIGLIFLCALAWRRLQNGVSAAGMVGGRPVELMQSVPLGPGRAVHLICVQGRELLVGSTAQQVSILLDLGAARGAGHAFGRAMAKERDATRPAELLASAASAESPAPEGQAIAAAGPFAPLASFFRNSK